MTTTAPFGKPITIRFHDKFNTNTNIFTDVLVSCLLKTYEDGKQFFYLNYTYTFSTGNHITKYGHPLINIESADNDGVIVAANNMTCKMIKYLKKLKTERIGYTNEEEYKKNIMIALSTFWA